MYSKDHSVQIGYRKITEPRLKTFIKKVVISDGVIIREGSIIYIGCSIGIKTMIGHHVVMREATKIGDHCRIGHLVVFEGATEVGDHTVISTQCHITAYSKIGSYVFMGPMTVTTNDPVMSHMRPNIEEEYQGVTILDGARIGAGCTILPCITIGREAMIGAGAIVTRDIPDYAIAYGTPAKVVGWVQDNAFLKNNGIDI